MYAYEHRCRIKLNTKLHKEQIELSFHSPFNDSVCSLTIHHVFALPESLFATSESRKDDICRHLWCFADMRHSLALACRESPWIKGFFLKSPIASELRGGLNWRLTARMGGGTGV